MTLVLPKRCLTALLAMLAGSTSLAAQPRLAPEIAFFSTALPELLASYRSLLDLTNFCIRTPAAACHSPDESERPDLSDMEYFLNRITTFPTRSTPLSHAQRERLLSPLDASAELRATRAEYENRLHDFDTQFLGHFGALLHVCADSLEKSDRTTTRYRVIREIIFANYWGESPQDSRKSISEVDSIAGQEIQNMRDFPKARCAVMLALGKKLLAPYGRRLKPYAGDSPDVSDFDRSGESLIFTWRFALEIEAHVRPAVLDEVDARESQSKLQAPK